MLVCPFCRSAVARTDRGLNDLGKVAEIADTQSPLKIGLKGTFKNTQFELTGRAQMQHELGGFWDEWYATFSNGWVGWLAEAQGKFYLTFYQPIQKGLTLPSFNDLQIGQTVAEIPNQNFVVTEKGTAASAAAEGEIPYQLTPYEKSDYADLSGANDAFATIDYSMNPPWVFVGQQVSLADIGLADAKPVTRQAQRVSTEGVGCPNCGGALSLTAPDKAERVTCPYCNSLLDVNQGKLSWLKALAPKPDAPTFVLPIGAEGTLDGAKYKLIGAVVRSVTIEGVQYFWHEYLLYNPSHGFRWLIHSDNHWNFVESINAADVVSSEKSAIYNGETYKIFQDAPARVEYVQGEFYWRVEQGETVRAIDYVNAPRMLSFEGTANELNWSIGTYQTNDEIEKAFNVSDLPKAWSVAPNQPFTNSFYYTWGLLPLALLFLTAILMTLVSGFGSAPLDQQIVLPPLQNATTAQAVFSQPFEIKSNRNVKITASAPINNSWADLNVDLINEQNDEVETVNVPIEYYSGVEDGESWSEGGQTQDATLSSLPAGKYTLKVEGTWQNWQQPQTVSVKVEQNVARGVNFCCALLILLFMPLIGILRKFSFESKRWSESMFSNSGSSDDSDDSE